MKRTWRLAGVLLGISLLATLLGLWWLLASGGGRDWTVARVVAAWPEGQVQIGKQEGSVAGGLRLRDVVFVLEGAEVKIALIELSPRLPSIGSRTVHVARLRVNGVRVMLRPTPETPEVPWVERLPTLAVPVGLRVDEFIVSDVQVQPLKGAAITLSQLNAAVLLDAGRLQVTELRVSAPLGRLSGELAYETARGYAVQAQLTADLAAGANAVLEVDGKLESGKAVMSGRAEGPWRLALNWTEGGAVPKWTLRGEGEALQLQTIGMAEDELLGFAIDAQGQGLAAAMEGQLRRGDQSIGIAPSALRWEGGVVHADPLALDVLQGRVLVTGQYATENSAMNLAADATGLLWGEGEARVQADGKATLRGSAQVWSADVDMALKRGAQRARVEASAEGTPERLVLMPLRVRSPGGSLEGRGEMARDDSGVFAFDVAMRALDPAWLLPEWPGQLSGQLQVRGAAPSTGEMHWKVDATALTGTLRGESVSGRAQVSARGDVMDVDADLAVSEGRLRAKGRVAPTLALALNAQQFDVAPWWSGAAGVLDGEMRVQGSSKKPALQADVDVRGFVFAEVMAEHIQLTANVPTAGAGELRLNADAVVAYGEPIESLEFQADGELHSANAQLRVRAARGDGTAEARWIAAEGFSSGTLTLQAAQASLEAFPAIALESPASLRWAKDTWSLPSALCLRIAENGRLCAQGNAERLTLEGERLDPAWANSLLPEDTETPPDAMALFSLQASVGRVEGAWDSAGVLRSAQAELSWRGDAQPDRSLRGEVEIKLSDLALLDALSADIAAPRGLIQGQLSVGGTLDAPRWSGAIDAKALVFDLPALGIAVNDGSFRVIGDVDGRLRLEGRLPTGDGALALQGEWLPGTVPLTLSLRGNDVRVLDTPDGQAWISPALDLVVDNGVARLRGRVDVPRASLQLDRFEQTAGASPDVVVVDDAVAKPSSSALALDADFVMALSDEVRLKGFGFDGRLSGELRIRDRVDRELRASGRLTLIGELRAYGQQLDLTRGEIRWANAPMNEPLVDVLAERPDSEPRVGVALSGSALAPVAEVWSKPALPQAEALSWLMFGRPLSTADGQDAAQLERAAASLGGSAVAQALAGKVGLDSASVGQSRALGGTALTVGKRINPKLYVSYGMALSGTGQVITVTYALRRWLAAQLESGEEQRVQLEATIDRD